MDVNCVLFYLFPFMPLQFCCDILGIFQFFQGAIILKLCKIHLENLLSNAIMSVFFKIKHFTKKSTKHLINRSFIAELCILICCAISVHTPEKVRKGSLHNFPWIEAPVSPQSFLPNLKNIFFCSLCGHSVQFERHPLIHPENTSPEMSNR